MIEKTFMTISNFKKSKYFSAFQLINAPHNIFFFNQIYEIKYGITYYNTDFNMSLLSILGYFSLRWESQQKFTSQGERKCDQMSGF